MPEPHASVSQGLMQPSAPLSNLPANEICEIDQPGQCSAVVLELQHDKVGEDGWNEEVEYSIAERVVQQGKACHCRVNVPSCTARWQTWRREGSPWQAAMYRCMANKRLIGLRGWRSRKLELHRAAKC